MNTAALASELTTDPLAVGYAGMTDQQAADSLSAASRSQIVPISSAELLAWSGAGATDGIVKCRYERIQDAAAAHATHSVRGACIAALGLIERDGTSLDLSLPDRVSMLNAIVGANVLTAQEQAEIEAMGTKQISRAEEIGLGSVVSIEHVASARSL